MNEPATLNDLNDPVMDHANTDFVAVYTHNSIGEALESIRRSQTESTILYFYVLDDEGRLKGTLQTRRLLTSPTDTLVESIMATNLIAIPDSANLMEALEFFILHKYLAFPVVDEDGKMRGVIDINVFTQEMIDMEEREQVHSVFDTLGVQIAEQVPQRIGLRGPVDDQMDLQTACFDLCDVGVDLGTRFGVAFFVDDDGETAV